MEPADVPKLIQLHEYQNERDGTHYPLPRFFTEDGKLDKNIALALTVLKDGEVRQAVYFVTKVVEACFVGCDSRASVNVAMDSRWILGLLKTLGFEAVRCFVPREVAPDLARQLYRHGFRIEDEFVQFYQEI